MENSRNNFIDIIKGVAIFLMLWGHVIQYCVAKTNIDFYENWVFKFIYSFHMPLFMLVSGYLFFYSFSYYISGVGPYFSIAHFNNQVNGATISVKQSPPAASTGYPVADAK